MLLSPAFYSSPMEIEPSSCTNITTSQNLQFPPGFRFHPSDEELIVHYLKNKVTSRPLPASFIAEIDLYKYNPWELPSLFCHHIHSLISSIFGNFFEKALYGEGEWYFFSPRDRKYPKGERPNRAAGSGYWKATGTDKPIFSSSGLSKPIGAKKALVFYTGRPPKGEKTQWFMNEYRLDSSITPPRLKGSMRLDDWVLCRVRCKGNMSKNTREIQIGYTTESERSLPRAEQTIFTRANRDMMITDYIHKDCILLAWMLSGQPETPIETSPRVDFEGSNNIGNSSNSFYEAGSSSVNCQIVSTMDNSFNIVNGETYEKNDKEHVDSKKSNEDNLTRDILAEADVWSYIQNQSLDDMYNANLTNELALTGRYWQ